MIRAHRDLSTRSDLADKPLEHFAPQPVCTIIPGALSDGPSALADLGGVMTGLISAVRGLAYGLALISIVVPAVSHAQQATPQRGGTLVMVVQPEPPTLASYQSTAGPIGQVATKVYEGLLEYDFNLQPIPGLAQSWTVSPDGKTITFKLQPGREVPRRPAVHQRRRPVHRAGRAEEDTSARHQHVPRGGGDRDPRSA